MRSPMSRAQASLSLLVLLALALPALVAGAPATQFEAAVRKPNIVLIVLDDLDARAVERMPIVDELLRERGTSFARFFVAMPSCCPSRASILRGQYPHNHGVVRNFAPDGGFPVFHQRGLERSTVATWLNGAGYRTGLFGKYLNEYPKGVSVRYVPPGWNRWQGWLASGRYFNYSYNENGKPVSYRSEPRDYETDVLSRATRDFIRRAADDRVPFFAYVAPPAPHEPAIPAPRHADKFANLKAPRPPSFNERNVDDKPAWVRRDSPRLSRKQIDQIDALYRDRARSLLAVDEMVADLFETMRATGTLDDTYVFFTSDNGFHLGEHRQAIGKGMPYEQSIRVPLFVWGPGVARRDEHRLASNVDLAPTIAELAGAAAPDFADGRSLVPLLRGNEPSWRRALLVESIAKDPPGGGQAVEVGVDEVEAAYDGRVGWKPPHIPTFRVLRTPDRVYVEYYRGADPEPVERELYDLRRDSDQLENLASDPDRAAEVDDLHAWLAALRDCAAAGCRAVEEAPPSASG